MFPAYVHSVLPAMPESSWLAQAQGINECGCTTPANALNLLYKGEKFFDKNQLVREAGVWFQRAWGGTPSFITEYLLRRHGAGTHFGNLSRTDGEKILRGLIDQGVPVCIELGQNKIGPLKLYGEHAVLLVGYSEPFRTAGGAERQEYYVIDAAFTDAGGVFGMHTNNVDHDGDGVAEEYPGNRTYERQEFLSRYPTGIYFPVFPSQAEHDRWYASHLRRRPRLPLIGWLRDRFITGSFDYFIV
jgi:hypothetical protein